MWNMSVVLFVKNYIYIRQIQVLDGKGGVFVKFKTLMFSAFWHGVEPSFYVLFFFMTLLNELSQDMAKCRPYLDYYVPRPISFVIGWWFSKQIYGAYLIPYFFMIHA